MRVNFLRTADPSDGGMNPAEKARHARSRAAVQAIGDQMNRAENTAKQDFEIQPDYDGGYMLPASRQEVEDAIKRALQTQVCLNAGHDWSPGSNLLKDFDLADRGIEEFVFALGYELKIRFLDTSAAATAPQKLLHMARNAAGCYKWSLAPIYKYPTVGALTDFLVKELRVPTISS